MQKLTLKEIQDMVDTDLAIDRTELEAESARTPQIHNKYLRLFTDTRNYLHSLRLEKSRMKKFKWLYYLEIVLSQISNRQWTIRNMIEWLKFTNGVN
jgi:hypothetical protein